MPTLSRPRTQAELNKVVQTGVVINANPVSFLIDANQHITSAAGQALFVFGLN